jgi:hypothetical protein
MGSEWRGSLRRLRGFANKHDIKILDYLAFISVKYEVDFEKLFDDVVVAWNQESSVCGDLRINCRGKFQDQVVFIITNREKTVTQFHLPERLLKRSDLLRDFKPDIQLHSRSRKKYRTTRP